MQGYIKEHFGTSKKSKEKASTKVGSRVRHLKSLLKKYYV